MSFFQVLSHSFRIELDRVITDGSYGPVAVHEEWFLCALFAIRLRLFLLSFCRKNNLIKLRRWFGKISKRFFKLTTIILEQKHSRNVFEHF